MDVHVYMVEGEDNGDDEDDYTDREKNKRIMQDRKI
jgi:hypothetical protein